MAKFRALKRRMPEIAPSNPDLVVRTPGAQTVQQLAQWWQQFNDPVLTALIAAGQSARAIHDQAAAGQPAQPTPAPYFVRPEPEIAMTPVPVALPRHCLAVACLAAGVLLTAAMPPACACWR